MDKIFRYSVIIPIEGRSSLLKKLLESLQSTIISDNIEFEVLVVDSSDSQTTTEIQAICKEYEALYYSGSRNVRQKRNQGVRNAKYPYLLFLDSDCEASLNLFIAYTDFIQNNIFQSEILAAAGPTQFQGSETFFTKIMSESSLLSPFRMPENKGNLLWTTTSNFLVSKKAFELAGGFNEDFPFRLGGDDTELGLLLYQIGCEIKAIPQAICFHSWQTWVSPISVIRRSFRWGWMQSIILQKHKTFRRWAPPGLPVYFLSCLVFSLLACTSGHWVVLSSSFCFLLLSVILHAVFSAFSKKSFFSALISDLILALVECPFGFGKVIGSLSRGNVSGIFFRIGIDDSDMDTQFSETVNDLWSNNIAILLTIIIIIWIV